MIWRANTWLREPSAAPMTLGKGHSLVTAWFGPACLSPQDSNSPSLCVFTVTAAASQSPPTVTTTFWRTL